MIINGEEIAKGIKKRIQEKISSIPEEKRPILAVIQVGKEDASNIYIQKKKEACQEVGIHFQCIQKEKTTSPIEIMAEIQKLNEDPKITAIFIQLPLPESWCTNQIINTIDPQKDVDGLTMQNINALWQNEEGFLPCTPKGIIHLLKEVSIPIEGKHVVLIGRSNIVGKPLIHLFLKENATVTILHSKSLEKTKIMKTADIIVSAVGKPKWITKEMVKKKSTIIDVGITRQNGKIVGDVDLASVQEKVSYITPVPKGVGPMTVAMLVENVYEAYQKNQKEE